MMYQQLTLSEAAALVQDGQTIALGGMTIYRRPTAFVRALLQRKPRPRDLTLLCFTAGFESDLLVGAGCVGIIRSCYFGLESFGFAPMFTAAAQAGNIRIMEETEASLALGIRAGISGVGFMPSRAWIGTELPRLRQDVKTIIDPYTAEELIAFPAIHCDHAIIHGLEGDSLGNVRINNNAGVDIELVYLSDKVVFTVERLVERCDRSVDSTLIPSPGADYIAHAPRGAWPTSCYPDYPLAGAEFLRYIDACNAGQFDNYLDQFLADGH
ncbi:MAG: CoA-transferase [Anaerolineae bacterium]